MSGIPAPGIHFREDRPIASKPWTVRNALELYNVSGWGDGYFRINDSGRLCVSADRDPSHEMDLFRLAMDLNAQGVGLPILLRFSDILRSRIEALNSRFAQAIKDCDYENSYSAVYPIKVNQQRHVLEELVEFGRAHGVGLEAGSKPELQAILAIAQETDHMIVCNGYKDEEYMRLALMGQRLGHKVFVVIEMEQEMEKLLEVAADMGVRPTVGVRVKLTSSGAGRWESSAGEKSKFGLNPAQLVRMIDRLKAKNSLDVLELLHFHIGSQVSDIRSIKTALNEVARFYTELRAMGAEITHVDVGGGLAVDYEGSRTTANSSANYSLQEYANDIVYTMAEVCRDHELPMPHLISESGRALTAHHAMLLINVIGVESQHVAPQIPVNPEEDHQVLVLLGDSLAEMDTRSIREVYHDALFAKSRARDLFSSGVLTLRDVARAEQLYLQILHGIARVAEPQAHEDILAEIAAELVDRYFCNFSIFQSLPDSWAIQQLFPIMPIHRLDEEPVRKATIQDVTCDSDGKIANFVGGRRAKTALEVHPLRPGEPYILGIFLTGAYQETLGDLHNLFGDTHAVHIRLRDGHYEVSDQVAGDTVTDVLQYVEFNPQELAQQFRRKVDRAQGITREERNTFIAEYMDGLEGYTYLEDPVGQHGEAEDLVEDSGTSIEKLKA